MQYKCSEKSYVELLPVVEKKRVQINMKKGSTRLQVFTKLDIYYSKHN